MHCRLLIFFFLAVNSFIYCPTRDFKSESNLVLDKGGVEHFVQFYRGERLIANFIVELAITGEERQKGLMGRKDLPIDHGMLFIFNKEDVHYFWMKNTYIPLDIIFINSEMRVVGVYKNATPLSEESISVAKPSKYVLEINAGLADKYGIGENSRVVFINIFP